MEANNKYKITLSTNAYLARRDARMRGKTEVALVENLTLKEARETLLDLFNSVKSESCRHWGVARRRHPHETNTFKDGTRSFEEDSRHYSIEQQ